MPEIPHTALDDLGHRVTLKRRRDRVVSLVPSLTEALASVHPDALVGATDWCTHPSDLTAKRVRGTKNPDVNAIVALRPDLVITNQEENRELDVRRLRSHGIEVWVTRIESVTEALSSMRRLFEIALEWPVPDWLDEAERLWDVPLPAPRKRVAVPIWRDPWMAVGRDTYTGDLLARAGLSNVLAAAASRYPHLEVDEIEAAVPDLILLPDEPYVFTATDGPEAFSTPTALVSGRLLTWYGPCMVEAHRMLSAL